MSNLHSAREEIIALRQTIRHTRRDLRKGTIDALKATRVITQASRSIASLLRLQRRLETFEYRQKLIDSLSRSVVKGIRDQARSTPTT